MSVFSVFMVIWLKNFFKNYAIDLVFGVLFDCINGLPTKIYSGIQTIFKQLFNYYLRIWL